METTSQDLNPVEAKQAHDDAQALKDAAFRTFRVAWEEWDAAAARSARGVMIAREWDNLRVLRERANLAWEAYVAA